MTPSVLTRPVVVFRPNTPLWAAGLMIEPLVSSPNATGTCPCATATAEPELEPATGPPSRCGFNVWPPRELQPSAGDSERKLDSSLILVLPTITTPAFSKLSTTLAFLVAGAPTKAFEPALVCMRSLVSKTSFSAIGTPCKCPRTRPSARSLSRAFASLRASGLVSKNALPPCSPRSILAICLSESFNSDSEVTPPPWPISTDIWQALLKPCTGFESS